MQKRGDCFRCLMYESHRCRTSWNNSCPDGMEFEEYTGSKVKQCIGATTEVYQDGYIHCPILDCYGCEWCMERLRADKSFFQPDPSQNYERVPRWIRDQNKSKEETMTTYYTKCGRTLEKSTKATVTGYEVPVAFGPDKPPEGEVYSGCETCPFLIDVQEGCPEKRHKRWECRAGSLPPNHTTEWRGSLEDKNTIQIYSLDHDLMESIIAFAAEHTDLSAAYNQDSQADCRRTVSVSCSGNRKGMTAKKELIDKFFPSQEATPDLTDEQDDQVCGDCSKYDPPGCDIGRCELNQMTVSAYRPACEDFGPEGPEDEELDEEELESMDLEDQLDVLLAKGDAEDKAMESNGRRCGSCSIGHWYSNEHTYVNVVQDDGIHTVKRPCKVRTHYCIQFDEGRREIAEDKDFDPDSAPGWCPLGEVAPPMPEPKKQPRTRSQGCQEMREDCPCLLRSQ